MAWLVSDNQRNQPGIREVPISLRNYFCLGFSIVIYKIIVQIKTCLLILAMGASDELGDHIFKSFNFSIRLTRTVISSIAVRRPVLLDTFMQFSQEKD